MLKFKDIENLETKELERLQTLLDPVRRKIFKELRSAKTISEVAAGLGIDRKPLYYHVQVLLKAGLVEKVEERKVGHLLESVYKAIDRIDFTRSHCKDPGPCELYGQVIMALTRETYDDSFQSFQKDPLIKAASRRIIMKIKSEDLATIPKQISELMHEFVNKVLEFDQEDGDVDYSVTVTHFQMP